MAILLVSDSSVLIDLQRGGLPEAISRATRGAVVEEEGWILGVKV
jgi:hypothetical protein